MEDSKASPQHHEQHQQQKQRQQQQQDHEPPLSASDLVPLYFRIVLHMFIFWLLQNINKFIFIPLMLFLINPIIFDPESICEFLGIKLQEVVEVEEEACSIEKAQHYFITAFQPHALLFMNMFKFLRKSLRENTFVQRVQEYFSLNCFLPLILLTPIFLKFGHYYYWFILFIPHSFILTCIHNTFIDPNSAFRKIMLISLAKNYSKTFVDWYLEKLRVNLRRSVYSCMLYQLYICCTIHLLAIIFHFLLMPHRYLVCIVMLVKNMLNLASIGLFLMAWVEVYTDKVVIASKKMIMNLDTKEGTISVDDQSDVVEESRFSDHQQNVDDDDDDINNEWIHLIRSRMNGFS